MGRSTETEGKGAGCLLSSPEVPGTGSLRIAQRFNSGQRRWQLLHIEYKVHDAV